MCKQHHTIQWVIWVIVENNKLRSISRIWIYCFMVVVHFYYIPISFISTIQTIAHAYVSREVIKDEIFTSIMSEYEKYLHEWSFCCSFFHFQCFVLAFYWWPFRVLYCVYGQLVCIGCIVLDIKLALLCLLEMSPFSGQANRTRIEY